MRISPKVGVANAVEVGSMVNPPERGRLPLIVTSPSAETSLPKLTGPSKLLRILLFSPPSTEMLLVRTSYCRNRNVKCLLSTSKRVDLFVTNVEVTIIVQTSINNDATTSILCLRQILFQIRESSCLDLWKTRGIVARTIAKILKCMTRNSHDRVSSQFYRQRNNLLDSGASIVGNCSGAKHSTNNSNLITTDTTKFRTYDSHDLTI